MLPSRGVGRAVESLAPELACTVAERAGEPLRVQRTTVDLTEHETVVDPPPAPHLQPFINLALAMLTKAATVAASRLTVRRPFAVLGVPSTGL